ncbi:MAG: SMR family transporter [Sphingobium phenoxybenzoativorans]
MGGITVNGVLLFLGATVLQMIGTTLLPASRGLTVPVPSVIMFLCFGIGFAILARLIASGMSLSMLIPLNTLVLTIGSVAVSILLYKENVPPTKLALLAGSGVMLALASRI